MHKDFFDLPAWKEIDTSPEIEEGDEWKAKARLEACKVAYGQWRGVFHLLQEMVINPDEKAATGDEKSPMQMMREETTGLLITNACIVGAKLRATEPYGDYVTRMAAAAIIRQHAAEIQTGVLMLDDEDDIDPAHIEIIRTEIDVFREHFISWISHFEKGDDQDEWGLFV